MTAVLLLYFKSIVKKALNGSDIVIFSICPNYTETMPNLSAMHCGIYHTFSISSISPFSRNRYVNFGEPVSMVVSNKGVGDRYQCIECNPRKPDIGIVFYSFYPFLGCFHVSEQLRGKLRVMF